MIDRFHYQRALSHREITDCEWARKPKCVCRCAGEFHGARRLAEQATAKEYEALPMGDPHRLQPKPEREADAKLRRYHRRYHHKPYFHWSEPEGNRAWPLRSDPETALAVEWCPLCVLDGRAKVA